MVFLSYISTLNEMFFLKSLIFSIFSPAFYREAVAHGGKKALGTFLLFTLLTSIISALYFAVTFGRTLLDLPNTLGEIPDISIENGELSLTPSKPYEFVEAGQYYAIDPTGSITEIPEGYSEGFLFTRDSMVIRSKEAYGDQTLTYDEVLTDLSMDSVNIDKDGVIDFLQTIGIVAIIASPVLIFFGSCISRLVSIFLIAVIGFIVLNAMEKRNSFKTSFILALYASIPVVYVNLLFGLIAKGLSFVGISFALGSICCLIPLFCSIIKWGAFWCIGAYGLSKGEGG